jgi:thiamine pyrophosphokinase
VNRIYNKYPSLLQKTSPKADLVIGDMDTADPHLIDLLLADDVNVKHTVAEAFSTDLDMALAAEPPHATRQPIVIAGQFNAGGRFDHSLSIANSLARAANEADIICASNEAAFVVLPPGDHVLPTEGLKGQTVGVFPLEPSVCSSTGLRFDMRDRALRFGMLDSGNAIAAEEVHVSTSGLLLFTVELNAAGVEEPKTYGSKWDSQYDFYA